MNDDDVATAVLNRYHETTDLVCNGVPLRLSYNSSSHGVSMYGPTTEHHRVMFHDSHLFDYLNSANRPVTETIVVDTLCDLYERPQAYPWVRKTARS